MDLPYALISDTHLHAWSVFSELGEDGINSRLRIILDEIVRAATTLKELGGREIFCAGDVFHVRGSMVPSVLNPSLDVFEALIRQGFEIMMIPGNHDLEAKDSARVTNAVTALEKVGVQVVHKPSLISTSNRVIAMVPWQPSILKLKDAIEELGNRAILEGHSPASLDLIVHAPLDGVRAGIPASGLTANILAELEFKRVFSGHYHNQVDFGNGVYNIGAMTHQTWSDVGSKEGFAIVAGDVVSFYSSKAPRFVDLANLDDLSSDLQELISGHYVRARVEISSEKHLPELRESLLKSGAAGVVIHPIKKASSISRSSSSVAAGASIDESIAEFIKEKEYKEPENLALLCAEILDQVRSSI
ncbi:MAG: hypothetical protein V7641_4228 [Blastocatellia bacterium]